MKDPSANNKNELISKIASDVIIDTAFTWVCDRRKEYSHNNDIWELRRNWIHTKPELQKCLLNGDYMFDPLKEIRFESCVIELWNSQDALVLKAIALVLGEHLAPVISETCHHVKGNGGAKEAVRKVMSIVSEDCHVMKSDVKSYYASIDHYIMFDLAEQYIKDPFVMRLIWDYLQHTVCFGENYREVTRGISLGCPLSSLMGALYLKPLDDALTKSEVFYARFMDDWVIIVPKRWKLRKIIKIVNNVLSDLKIEKHPDKTFIGRAEKGFDFLGYWVKPGMLSVSQTAMNRHVERITRLYEQGASYYRIGQYVIHWFGWLKAGVKGLLSYAPLLDKHYCIHLAIILMS
jgi:RNA-directed DNA polymerase